MKLNTTSKTIGGGLIGAILSAVILVEGGYVNNPLDPGGETKYGITEQVARSYGYEGQLIDLTKEQALRIYQDLYVEQPNFASVVEINPAIGHKLIDAGINVGTTRVSIWFQTILNNYSQSGVSYPRIAADGIIGQKTLEAYRNLEAVRGKVKACTLVLKALDGLQLNYYMSLGQYNNFLIGWVDKRIQNIPLSQCEKYNLTVPLSKDK